MTENIVDMVDTDGAANGSVEAEDKEVFLVPPANTVTEEEAVVVQDVDTPPVNATFASYFSLCSREYDINYYISEILNRPAVRTMVGPVGHMQVTTEALLVPGIILV